MLRRVLSNLPLVLAIFVAPLAPVPERLVHPAPYIGVIAALIMLVTQPPLPPSKMVRESADRLTGLLIFASVIGANLGGVLEFGYRSTFQPAPLSLWTLAGLSIIVIGLALRIWAIRTLGCLFTSTVHVEEDQRVVQHGPYRVLRHPSYTGALLASCGVALCFQSVVAALLTVVLGGPGYIYRIVIEERTLGAKLGNAYLDYAKRSWRLIPFVY